MDTYTREGAQSLANTIESYWRTRGYRGVIAMPVAIGGVFGVQSNIGPKGPPRRAPGEGLAIIHDYLNWYGATFLANQIMDYWHARGRRVIAEVIAVPGFDDAFEVRSDLLANWKRCGHALRTH